MTDQLTPTAQAQADAPILPPAFVEDQQKKADLVREMDKAIAIYTRYRQISHFVQWLVLISVTIAGFLTTAAGGIDPSSMVDLPWFAEASALTIFGLISAIGAIIVQNAAPGQLAMTFEKRKDAVRSIRTAIKYRGLDIATAAMLFEMARSEPAQAMDELAAQYELSVPTK